MEGDEDEAERCRTLLRTLKSTAEGLLLAGRANVWSVYGGLGRLHAAVSAILQHGLNATNSKGVVDCWVFVDALRWLQPALATSPQFCASPQAGAFSDWLTSSLERHCLSSRLGWLISDTAHLATCYSPGAFLRRREYAEASLVCLRAVEQGQPELLTDLDPRLYLSAWSSSQVVRTHRRCSSFPDHLRPGALASRPTVQQRRPRAQRRATTAVVPSRPLRVLSRQWSSEPTLVCGAVTTPRPRTRRAASQCRPPSHSSASQTPAVTPISSPPVLEAGVELATEASEETCREEARSEPLDIAPPRPSHLSLSLTPSHEQQAKLVQPPRSASDNCIGKKETVATAASTTHRKTSSEGGWNPIPLMTPPTLAPIAMQGSVLPRLPGSFLASSGRFSDPAEELSRENAHFSVSEAMIAAIERTKCERAEQRAKQQRGDESEDEEIARLQERIRLRRREKEQRERRQAVRGRRTRPRRPKAQDGETSDGRTDTATPTTTTATASSSSPSLASSGSEPEDIPVQHDNLARVRDSGISASMASLYSESELQRSQVSQLDWASSAEGVAWGLLRQFHGRELPRDTQLKWLVSEEDAPQQLLPLPSSWPVSPDEAEDEDMRQATPLRGTLQWAPPRPQIIFTPHPPPNRRALLSRQGHLCAGCGMRVAPQYASKFRYCEYLGRYFCTGCHGNQLAVIPGRVLDKWDFTRYPVSSFSYRLLEQLQSDALFPVEDLNSELLRRSRQLARCKLARTQLAEMQPFVTNCRFAQEERLQAQYSVEPAHLTSGSELYSLRDLLEVKNGTLLPRLQQLIDNTMQHVANCQLCQARGFVCESCRGPEVIFPWEVSRVVRCPRCGCCLHLKCLPAGTIQAPADCPRCRRRSQRTQ